MIIGIDGNEANNVRGDIRSRVGSNVVAFQMLWALYKTRTKWKDKHKINVYLSKKPNKDLPPEDGDIFKYEILHNSPFWVITRLMPRLYRNDRPDVLHTFSHYLPPFLPIPMGCTIHDLGFLKYSGQFTRRDYWQLRYWTAMSINVSKYIISVSKYTKKDLIKNYDVSEEKVHVIHNAYDGKLISQNISAKNIQEVLEKYSIDRDYIFFLGTLKPSKNLDGLIRAFARLEDKNYKLVVTGSKGWMYQSAIDIAEKLKVKDRLVFTGFVTENEKLVLLRNAKMLVSPSFWEGFGIHVIESMVNKTPVVVSKRASLPEIVENAGIYVDPDSTDSIAKGITKVINMSNVEYNKLVEMGVRQTQKFSWGKSARKLIEVLEKVVKY